MRLIDADALVSALNNGRLKEQTGRAVPFNAGVAFALTMVEYAQTIDAVPVVKCKDCKYWDKDTLRHNSNDAAEWDECECEMLANRDRWNEIDRYCCGLHFCADGERRDDE